jgi:hypothetical protein
MTLELREMGTRDRVMTDCQYLSPQENLAQILLNSGGNADEKVISTGRRSKNMSSEMGLSTAHLKNDAASFSESTYSSLYKAKESHGPFISKVGGGKGLHTKNSSNNQTGIS